jgi:hypothetical protein
MLISDSENHRDLNTPLLGMNYSHMKNFVRFKVFSFSFIIIIILLANNFSFFSSFFKFPNDSLGCYYDSLHLLFADLNSFFTTSLKSKYALLIFASAIIDILVFYTLYLWIFKWQDWVLVTSIIMFYTFRIIILSFYQQTFPDNYIFEYPGFPSPTVSYLKTNDFFYSGHVGFPCVFVMEFFKRKYYKMTITTIAIILIEGVMMLSLRGHYSLDLFFGIIAGFYSQIFTEKYLKKPINKWMDNLIS